MLLEICAQTLTSARTASRAGAHRIELCSALDTGGVTPSAALIQQAVRGCSIPVMVLIRPREGGFCYGPEDVELMCSDIAFCRQAGAAGVVIGALQPDGRIDRVATGALLEAARGLDVTFHRAFDLTPDPFEALDTLLDMGIPRLLSSGQAGSAYEGRELLRRLIQLAGKQLQIMPGSGVNAQNIAAIARHTGAAEFHSSAKAAVVASPAPAPELGLDSRHWETQEEQVRQLLGELDSINFPPK